MTPEWRRSINWQINPTALTSTRTVQTNNTLAQCRIIYAKILFNDLSQSEVHIHQLYKLVFVLLLCVCVCVCVFIVKCKHRESIVVKGLISGYKNSDYSTDISWKGKGGSPDFVVDLKYCANGFIDVFSLAQGTPK